MGTASGISDDIVVTGRTPYGGYDYLADRYFFDIFGVRGSREVFGETYYQSGRFLGPTSPESQRATESAEQKAGFFGRLWWDFKRWLSQIAEGIKNAKWSAGLGPMGWSVGVGGFTYTRSKNNKPTNPASVDTSILPSGNTLILIIAAIVVFWLVIR